MTRKPVFFPLDDEAPASAPEPQPEPQPAKRDTPAATRKAQPKSEPAAAPAAASQTTSQTGTDKPARSSAARSAPISARTITSKTARVINTITRQPRTSSKPASDAPGQAQTDQTDQATAALPDETPAPSPQPPLGPRTDIYDRVRGIRWGVVLVSSVFLLISLSVTLWLTSYVHTLISQQGWIGWLAFGLLCTAGVAAAILLAREIIALGRLHHQDKLRQQAEQARLEEDVLAASEVTDALYGLYEDRKEVAWSKLAVSEQKDDILSAEERLTLAEKSLLEPLDLAARKVVTDSAKQIAIATALSPFVILDIVFVAAANFRMLRQLAVIYGGRPGTFGLMRLMRMVLGQLIIAGGIALGEDVLHQLIGQRVTSKLSSRLGEGLLNGALTARIGIAAIALIRPLPFIAAKPMRFRDILTEIATAWRGKSNEPQDK